MKPPGISLLFDYEDALDRVDGQQELLREIIVLFLEDCPGMLAEIRRSVTSRDHDSTAFVAHKLAGALGSISAEPARRAARKLEEVANADRDQVPKHLEALETAITELATVLRDNDRIR
jgi:HPt (histidine-containing phosphotransfer) domain-containing protein